MRCDCERMRSATAGGCAPRLGALNLVPIATRMQMDNTTTAERQHEIQCVHRLWLTTTGNVSTLYFETGPVKPQDGTLAYNLVSGRLTTRDCMRM